MPRKLPPELRDIIAIQSGVIERRQALRLGLDRDQIWNLLRSGRWLALHHGVYATFSGPAPRSAQLWAVVLRAGPGAALSHFTAAEVLGLTTEQSRSVHVTVEETRHPGPIQGAVVHRSRRIETARHPAQLPPRTRVEDTVLDLTQCAPSLDQAFDWLCRAVSRRLTTPERLADSLRARPRARWRADLQVAVTDLAGGIRSLLERRYVTSVERAHGLPPARRQVHTEIGGRSRYVDNLYDEAQLVVELDGQVAHPPEQRWADARRDVEHACAGLLTVRYNWADVTERPCLVAAQVAELLRSRGVPVALRPCGAGCTTARKLPR